MTSYSIYQVDAFANQVFSGNPAAVVLLPKALPDSILQAIAAENNLSETAFVRMDTSPYQLRWFTPTTEVALCGHATLAAAWVLYEKINLGPRELIFDTLHSGKLSVARENNGLLTLNFPADDLTVESIEPRYAAALGGQPLEAISGKTDLLLVYPSQSDIEGLQPNFQAIKEWEFRGVIATAPSTEEGIDFVSRFFGPSVGVDEDPVTGSAHTTLAPYWAQEFGKQALVGRQLSSRGGIVYTELIQDRVLLKGHGQLYMEGQIYLEGQIYGNLSI
jgi:PhzF family phenazine biosynthesis protein